MQFPFLHGRINFILSTNNTVSKVMQGYKKHGCKLKVAKRTVKIELIPCKFYYFTVTNHTIKLEHESSLSNSIWLNETIVLCPRD